MGKQEQCADLCEQLAALSREALDWINDPENADQVDMRKKDLATLLRKSTRRAERLCASARTNMSVSVFGPSQAGKSFLVSVLARPTNGRLVADFNGENCKLDYISEVNPAGEGESTGLVTRFTTTKAPTPDGFPVQLNLLSEADIVRTIINSFFEDGDQSEPPPDPDSLKAHFEQNGKTARSEPTGGMAFEEVHEIQDYVQSHFGKTAYASALTGFWSEAADFLPRMNPEERGKFLSIVWGGYEPLTKLYVKLATALAKVNHAEIVYAPIEALRPREESIIDVNTLAGLFAPDGENMLSIQTADGQKNTLNRAVITALAAELVVPMRDQPSKFFAETDLLDFPGARNRFELPLSITLERSEDSLTNMLLRGKVAYLFDRYVENQEITSMLLCVPDSNMETLSLPNLVEKWIELTHGATPEERAKSDCILFFVLTKFDKHLIDSASGGEDSVRFERRMDASLLKGFGKVSTSWVHEWTDASPFQNCFWLRNPYYPIEALITYADEREVEIISDKVDRVAELKTGCLQTASVKKHFKDPDRAWDAALTLNDGGVNYLVEELTKVCKPESKIRQISIQMQTVAHRVQRELAQFHVSDDIEERIEEKRVAVTQIIDQLELTLANHRFGAFINALSVDQDVVQDRISRVPSSVRITSAVAGGVQKPAAPLAVNTGATRQDSPPLRPNAPLRPGAISRPHRAVKSENDLDESGEQQKHMRSSVRTMTPEVFQADTAVEVWIERLSRFREDQEGLKAFQLNSDLATDLVNELIHGFHRLGARDLIINELKSIAFGMTVDRQAPAASILCSERINHFVATLLAEAMENGKGLTIDLGNGHSRQAFALRSGAESANTLPVEQRPSAEQTWTDWVFALEALFVENAKEGDAGTVNIEQNLRLGKILGQLGHLTG